MAENMVTVKQEDLKKLTVKKMIQGKVPEDQAAVTADVLIYADLRGVHSHGVLRVEHYLNRIRSGGLNLNPVLSVQKLKPSIAMVDAQGGFGTVSTRFAMEAAIEIAREQGICMMGVKNNSHCGALGYYAQMALDAKMASLVMGNTDSCVVPFGAKSASLGTNPLAFGYPGEKESILLDMATSEVAWGKILYAREKNLPIPEGWALDKEGNIATDPQKAVSLFPFGGVKGYGINLMVEILTGLLISGVFGLDVKKMYGDLDTYRNISNFILVIDPSVFSSAGDFLKTSQELINRLHAQAAAPGFEKVMIPGDIENRNRVKALAEGILIPQSIYDFLAK